jgi:hypothetical protein
LAFTGFWTAPTSTPDAGWTALTKLDSMFATFAAVPRTAVSSPARAVGWPAAAAAWAASVFWARPTRLRTISTFAAPTWFAACSRRSAAALASRTTEVRWPVSASTKLFHSVDALSAASPDTDDSAARAVVSASVANVAMLVAVSRQAWACLDIASSSASGHATPACAATSASSGGSSMPI